MIRTLSVWTERFLRTPTQVQCAKMEIFGFSDLEPAIFTGVGVLHLDTPTFFRFLMHAEAHDASDAFKRLMESDRSPYEVEHAFRLVATDYDGVEWSCGWTTPRIVRPSASGSGLLLEGSLSGMSAMVEGAFVSTVSGVELIFNPPPRVPLEETLVTTASIGIEEIAWRRSAGRQRCSVLGSTVEVSRDPWSENLWLVASVSEQLPLPYLENWLSEPLRVLCGQLAYPRLAARNLGEGRAYLFVRPSPSLRSRVGGLATMIGAYDATSFWEFYQLYLIYLSNARDAKGDPYFESNPATRFHEEIIQAAKGSRWMLALSVTSAIEGMSKLSVTPAALPRDFDETVVASIREHIESWQGNEAIRTALISHLAYLGRPAVSAYLRELVAQSLIKPDHRKAWEYVRNRVAHGVLGEPWPDEESETRLRLLLELLYILTCRLVGFTLAPPPSGKQTP